MTRFLLPPHSIRGQKFTLDGPEARHVLTVLRKKTGDVLELFDGKDASYRGRIDSIQDGEIQGTLLEGQAGKPLPVQVALYQALAKGAKWDWVVEKACEIGVARIVPIGTRRSIVKAGVSGREKIARWNRIALAAAKQCGRSDVLQVETPRDLADAFRGLLPSELSLIPYEKENERTIREGCQGFHGTGINLFIGPEGGWDPGEIELALAHRVLPVRLGPTLLRTETAGLVAATLVLREFGIY